MGRRSLTLQLAVPYSPGVSVEQTRTISDALITLGGCELGSNDTIVSVYHRAPLLPPN